MNHDDDNDFLSLTLSLRTRTPSSDAAPPLPDNLVYLSDTAPTLPDFVYWSISPPHSNPLYPTSFQQTDIRGPPYHPHTPLGVPSYQCYTPLANPFFNQGTAVGVQPPHQGAPARVPCHHQGTAVGVPPNHQGTAVGVLPLQPTTIVGCPPNNQRTTVVRGRPKRQRTATGRSSRKKRRTRRTSVPLKPGKSITIPPPNELATSTEAGRSSRENSGTQPTSIRLKPGKSEIIPPPYEWATDRRAIIHNLEYIQSRGIHTITGSVKCKECNRKFQRGYDLLKKFKEIHRFVIENKDIMWERAPKVWNSPPKLDCEHCNRKNCVEPADMDKKRSINWLFLLLGQMIGHCTILQLKYFCKHNCIHRTGAKDRLVYSTYLKLCGQLDPNGLFYS